MIKKIKLNCGLLLFTCEADEEQYSVPNTLSFESEDSGLEYTVLGVVHYCAHRQTHLCVFSGGDLVMMTTFDLSRRDQWLAAYMAYFRAICYSLHKLGYKVEEAELIAICYSDETTRKEMLDALSKS